MPTAYTKPRLISVEYLRPGDEVAVWREYPTTPLVQWHTGGERDVLWKQVQDIVVRDEVRPDGARLVTFTDGSESVLAPEWFVVIREAVETPGDAR